MAKAPDKAGVEQLAKAQTRVLLKLKKIEAEGDATGD
jgi:hypothetical protein